MSVSDAESPEEWFRVRVSLERFFSDERARVLVRVARARRVRWLARRLRALFPLPRRLALLSRGHLLPPDETLALLQHDDPVEVIPATVKLNPINGCIDRQLTTKDDKEKSTPDSMEPLQNCKRRRKNQELCQNDSVLPVVMDTPITPFLLVHTETDTCEQKSIAPSQEPECLGDLLQEHKRSKINKQIFYYDLDTEHHMTPDPKVIVPAVTENICVELEQIEQNPEVSDSERIRVLKEQALAVLDQVAVRPRRRQRVRRRRKPLPLVDFSSPLAAEPRSPSPVPVPMVYPTVETVSESFPDTLLETVPESAPDNLPETVPESPERAADSTDEPLDVPSCGAPAVLRNWTAAPRSARLVHSLGDVASVPLCSVPSH